MRLTVILSVVAITIIAGLLFTVRYFYNENIDLNKSLADKEYKITQLELVIKSNQEELEKNQKIHEATIKALETAEKDRDRLQLLSEDFDKQILEMREENEELKKFLDQRLPTDLSKYLEEIDSSYRRSIHGN